MPDISSDSKLPGHISLLRVISPDSGSNENVIYPELTENLIAVSSSVNQLAMHNVRTAINNHKNVLSRICGWLPYRSSENRTFNDVALQAVHEEGGQLQRLAGDYVEARRLQQAYPYPFGNISGKTGWLTGIALVSAGIGVFTFGCNQFGAGRTGHRSADLIPGRIKPDGLTGVSTPFTPVDFLPGAAAMWSPKISPITEKFQPDDVKPERLDFTCLENRQTLTLANIFRQIGNALSNPVMELAKESQVIDYYNRLGRCPDNQEIEKLAVITIKVDQTVSALLSLIPGMSPVVMMQKLGGDLFRILADGMENNPLNQQDFNDVNLYALTLAKMAVDFSPKGKNGQVIKNRLSIPKKISLKNNLLQISINGNKYTLAVKQNGYVASGHGREFSVSYSNLKKAWIPLEEEGALPYPGSGMKNQKPEKSYSYFNAVDLEMVQALKDIPSLAKNLFRSSSPNENGIYRYTLPPKKRVLYAINFNGKFYQVRLGKKDKRLRINGKPELEIQLHEGKYYLVNNIKRGRVVYLPCRIKRTPTSFCMSYSEDIQKILAENHSYGIDTMNMGWLKPDKTNPAILVSTKNKKYIQYLDVLFKVKIIPFIDAGRKIRTEVRIYGKKRMGWLRRKENFQLGNAFFSEINGNSFLHSKVESTIEALGMRRPVAEAYQSLMDFENANGPVTADEYLSLRTYGGVGYRNINNFMLNDMPEVYGYPDEREKILRQIATVRGLLKKLPSYEGLVYRGSTLNDEGLRDLSELKAEDIISSKKFISTSIERHVARSFSAGANGVSYKIHVKKAAHPVMAFTGKLREAEVLIEDNTVFRCLAVYGRDIELEEIVNPSKYEMRKLKYRVI